MKKFLIILLFISACTKKQSVSEPKSVFIKVETVNQDSTVISSKVVYVR